MCRSFVERALRKRVRDLRLARHLRLARAITASLVLIIVILAGCQGKPPMVSRVFAQPVLVRDPKTGGRSEKLSVFVVASDPDGAEDLEAFYVINDDAELFWKVERSGWMELKAEGESWIGTNALTVPSYEPLPAGEFRVVLQDKGGENTEQSFVLPEKRPALGDASFPSLASKDGIITVRSPFPGPQVWAYDPTGKFLFSLNVAGASPQAQGSTEGTVDAARVVATLPNPAQPFTLWAYAREPAGTYALLTGPYPSEAMVPK